jgi:cytochrome P450
VNPRFRASAIGVGANALARRAPVVGSRNTGLARNDAGLPTPAAFHFCLGAAAARLQARVVFEELLARCPDFAVDADADTFADGAFTRRYEKHCPS